MKIYYKKNKGFTLIELLVVILIIGILASIVFVSLNDARKKSKDSFLRQEAKQMQLLLEQEYLETGSYFGLNPRVWMNNSTDCDSIIGSIKFSQKHATEVMKICKAIIEKASVKFKGSPTEETAKFFLGVQIDPNNRYSIMIALPYKRAYLCLGNRESSETTDTAAKRWGEPGCYGDQTP